MVTYIQASDVLNQPNTGSSQSQGNHLTNSTVHLNFLKTEILKAPEVTSAHVCGNLDEAATRVPHSGKRIPGKLRS